MLRLLILLSAISVAVATGAAQLRVVDIPTACNSDTKACEPIDQYWDRVNLWRDVLARTPGLCTEVGYQTSFLPQSALLGQQVVNWQQTEAILTATTGDMYYCDTTDSKDCSGVRYPNTHPRFIWIAPIHLRVTHLHCLTNNTDGLAHVVDQLPKAEAMTQSVPARDLGLYSPWTVLPTNGRGAPEPVTPSASSGIRTASATSSGWIIRPNWAIGLGLLLIHI